MSAYYDLDDILAEETKIPCVFAIDGHGLGFLDERAGARDIEAGAKVELPFWMCQALATREMVDIEMPRYFADRFKTKMLADPASVNLQDRCDYFYELGLKLALLVRDPEIGDMLQRGLRVRFREIIARDPTYRSPDYSAFVGRLCHFERVLLETKQASANDMQQWARRRGGRIAASSTIGPRGRKRGRKP